jgi:hypothetical protein
MKRRKNKAKPMEALMLVSNRKAQLHQVVVENPYFARGHAEGRTNQRIIGAVINARESAVTTLAAKGVLTAPQVAAADHFRRLWEAMGGKGASAIDYSREHVDGGPIPEPIKAFQIDAGKQLMLAFSALKERRGVDGYKLVCAIAGEGRSIHELTASRRERDTTTDILRACLDVLSEHWGYSMCKKRA